MIGEGGIRRMWENIFRFLIIGFLFLFFSGCSEKTGDQLVVYTPISEEVIEQIIPLFEEETGITVELITASTGELLNRIKSEAENPVSDVLWGGSSSLISPMKDSFEHYVSENDQYLLPEFRNDEGYMTNYGATTAVILVNTELIGDKEINGYQDLLNPELKGKIAHGDVAVSGTAFNHLENMLFAMGKDHDPYSDEAWEYVEAFLKNLDGKIVNHSSSLHKGVVDGEYAIGLTYETPALEYMQDGAPVEVIYMDEGVIFRGGGSYIIKDAKNMELAKIFNDFMISKKAQDTLGLKTSSRPTREDAQLSEEKVPLHEINVLDFDDNWSVENAQIIIEKYMELLTTNEIYR